MKTVPGAIKVRKASSYGSLCIISRMRNIGLHLAGGGG